MRPLQVVNLFICTALLAALAAAGTCLASIHFRLPNIESFACPLLGPSIVITVLCAVVAITMFTLGVMMYLDDRSKRLVPSLYVFNMLLAIVIPIGLLV